MTSQREPIFNDVWNIWNRIYNRATHPKYWVTVKNCDSWLLHPRRTSPPEADKHIAFFENTRRWSFTANIISRMYQIQQNESFLKYPHLWWVRFEHLYISQCSSLLYGLTRSRFYINIDGYATTCHKSFELLYWGNCKPYSCINNMTRWV